MEGKRKYPPSGLTGRYISSIEIVLDLIPWHKNWLTIFISLDLKASSIVTSVYIFVEVFNGGNATCNFDIDMTIIFLKEIRVVWNDMLISENETVFLDQTAVIASSI